jgi:hypothetical protein
MRCNAPSSLFAIAVNQKLIFREAKMFIYLTTDSGKVAISRNAFVYAQAKAEGAEVFLLGGTSFVVTEDPDEIAALFDTEGVLGTTAGDPSGESSKATAYFLYDKIASVTSLFGSDSDTYNVDLIEPKSFTVKSQVPGVDKSAL